MPPATLTGRYFADSDYSFTITNSVDPAVLPTYTITVASSKTGEAPLAPSSIDTDRCRAIYRDTLMDFYAGKIGVIMVKKTTSQKAFSIIEIMIAIAVFLIAFLGTSAYRYGAAMDARKADLQTKATRTALLFSEAWNGKDGAALFKPVTAFSSDIDIEVSVGPDVPVGFTWLGSYKVNFERTDYYVTLSWKKPDPGLKVLSVIVNWDATGQNTGSLADAQKSYRLTTYVENPS